MLNDGWWRFIANIARYSVSLYIYIQIPVGYSRKYNIMWRWIGYVDISTMGFKEEATKKRYGEYGIWYTNINGKWIIEGIWMMVNGEIWWLNYG